jgi:N utilization substance protein A
MTKEIVEAVGVLEREKGISADRLMAALEDALLSAYKKTPGAAKYARVEVDRSSGDFRVYELLLPPDLEEQLLDEVEEEAGEPTVDPETGEMVYPEPPEIDQERLAQYRDQIEEHDVTPEDFGRIAAQTAKQVILQRIREAERDMMFNEYQDRVGELITGSPTRATRSCSCASASRRCFRAASRCMVSATTTASASRPSSPTSRTRRRGRRSSCRGARRS